MTPVVLVWMKKEKNIGCLSGGILQYVGANKDVWEFGYTLPFGDCGMSCPALTNDHVVAI